MNRQPRQRASGRKHSAVIEVHPVDAEGRTIEEVLDAEAWPPRPDGTGSGIAFRTSHPADPIVRAAFDRIEGPRETTRPDEEATRHDAIARRRWARARALLRVEEDRLRERARARSPLRKGDFVRAQPGELAAASGKWERVTLLIDVSAPRATIERDFSRLLTQLLFVESAVQPSLVRLYVSMLRDEPRPTHERRRSCGQIARLMKTRFGIEITDDRVKKILRAAPPVGPGGANGKRLKGRVQRHFDAQEKRLLLRMTDALATVQSRRLVRRTARVGYDLERGETVLADLNTGRELQRRPMTERERRIAEAMPEPDQS